MTKKELQNYLPIISETNFEEYLRQLENYPKLNFDNQTTEFSTEKLVEVLQGHFRFVISIAKEYFILKNPKNLYYHLLAEIRNKNYNKTTIIQNGNKGLVNAIIKYVALSFTEKENITFDAFSIWHIRNSILNHQAKATGIERNNLAQLGNKNEIEKMYIAKCKELLKTDLKIKNNELAEYLKKSN